MSRFFVVVMLLISITVVNAQDAQNPWHLIAFENEREVAFYNTEMIAGIEATAQNVTIVLDNGKEFTHPLALTTFGFEPRKVGTATENEDITTLQWTVRYATGMLYFSEMVSGIAVYTVNGSLVAQFAGKHSEVPVSLASGIFIVQAGSKSAKLFVGASNGGTITQAEINTNTSVYASASVNLQTGDAIKACWSIIANRLTSVEIPNVEKFYFTADNSIVLTMKNGNKNEIAGYQGCVFSIEPVQPDVIFCRFLSMKTMEKTIPVINEFLEGLQETLTSEQKLQDLVKWLKSHPCIIDAIVLCESCIYTNPPMSEILISFKENGITKELILDISMTSPLKVLHFHEDYVPMDVTVKTIKGFTIDKVFDFINSLDHDVERIYSGVYVSAMAPGNLQYILDCLNAKPYTNDGNAWWVTGYLHYLTHQITIFPTLFNMTNKDYQNDWLKSIIDYQLIESMNYDFSGHIIHFRVPEGTEKQWEKEFRKYEFVEWAELNYMRHVILGSIERQNTGR